MLSQISLNRNFTSSIAHSPLHSSFLQINLFTCETLTKAGGNKIKSCCFEDSRSNLT